MAAAENITLLSPEKSDAGTVTGSSEGSGAPASNLQNLQPTKVWSTASGVLDANVTLDFGQPEAVKQLYFGKHNSTVNGTIRIRAASQSGLLTANPGYDSGPLPARSYQTFWSLVWGDDASDPSKYGGDTNDFFLHLPTVQTFRHWRIDFADPGNAANVLQAGRMIIGNPWQSPRNPTLPVSIGYLDSTEIEQTSSRRTIINEKKKARVIQFQFRFFEESDFRNNMEELIRLRGGAKDILAVLRPDATTQVHKELFYGLMPSDPAQITTAMTNKTLYTQKFAIKELL